MRGSIEIRAGVELSDYRDARERYRPSKIDVLWVAESPPVGGGYFYFETTSSHNHLFRDTMKALYWWPETETMHAGTNKIPYLKKFHNHGYFLIDSSEKPLNDIKKDRQRKPVISE